MINDDDMVYGGCYGKYKLKYFVNYCYRAFNLNYSL